MAVAVITFRRETPSLGKGHGRKPELPDARSLVWKGKIPLLMKGFVTRARQCIARASREC